MGIQSITPDAAHRLMTATDQPHCYLDVRTVEEFEAGHPDGAINVPIAHMGSMGMQMNPDFLRVVQAVLPPETRLVVGCMSGGRSAKACELLASAGYATLFNVDGGFGGRRDVMGQLIQKGWADLGLPVARGNPPEGSYESLRARAT
jgi:rhodanese-related sulfurtransferase